MDTDYGILPMPKHIEEQAEYLTSMSILASCTYDVAQVYNWGNALNMVNNLSAKNTTDFASEYTKVENAILTDMEKTFPKN